MPVTLRINLLGGFRLFCDDTLITALNTPRLQSLVTYLVLHCDSPQPRQHLAFLLWPDSTEAQARMNLRHLIHQLRQTIPEIADFLEQIVGHLMA
jgi:DNA-binding SARP family transcriptional activator